MTEIILPQLGEGIDKAVVACWHVKVGDSVVQVDDVVEVVTDKATFNVPANSSGEIIDIKVAEGKEAAIGSVLAIIQ